MAAVMRPGAWKRAGMSAALMGLDLSEAMASLPGGLDRNLARRLLIVAEAAYLPAAWALIKARGD